MFFFCFSKGQWALDHIRGSRETFLTEIEDSGFELIEETDDLGLSENYVMVFIKKDTQYTN